MNIPKSCMASPLYMGKSFKRNLLGLSVTLLLAACGGGDVSDELAQDPPFDISLEQCELANAGVVGTPTEAVVIDGVETQACLLNTDLPKDVGEILLKSSHQYQPLVWVLDGVYEIGESKSYNTFAELQDDPVVSLNL